MHKPNGDSLTFQPDLKQLISYAADKYKDSTAFRFERVGKLTDKSFIEFQNDINAFGTYLYSKGYKKKKIAILSENSYEWIVAYFAVINGSGIIEPFDKELGNNEVLNLLNAGECDLLIYSRSKQKVIESFGADVCTKDFFCTDDFQVALDEGNRILKSGYRDYIDNKIDPMELAAIIFTSGTTGNPKGVMLSHHNLSSDAYLSCYCMYIPDYTVAILPLNHTFGFMACILCQILMGHSVFINNSLKSILKDINTAKPRHISMVPLFVENFYKNIWKNAKKQGKDKALKKLIKLSNGLRRVGIDMRKVFFKSVIDAFGGRLEMLISGGAPIDDMYMKGFDDFGITIINGYGITECSPIVALNRNDNIRYGTVGEAIEKVHIKIDNPNDNGEGEILVRGDIVMMGYYKNQEETDRVLRDGWFYTGDIGRLQDGFLTITGRKKNLILLDNGKNVYPEELENLISHIDNVTEVLAYEENGVITAEIYAEHRNEQIEEQIRNDVAQMNKNITGYKNVRAVKFRDEEFVKTTTKKIKRTYTN